MGMSIARIKSSMISWKRNKFEQLADLGVVSVPQDYVHPIALASFWANNRNSFHSYNAEITDSNFANPSYVLKPGERLWVRAYKQIATGTSTTKERIAFLDRNEAVYPGAQGAALVFSQMKEKLPKGHWYLSLDREERLWTESDGNVRVPELTVGEHNYCFLLGYYGLPCFEYMALLCFTKVLAKPRGRLLGT